MFIIPLDRKINWKRPPVITIIIVFINVVVYFGYQVNDEALIKKARSYFYNSGLYLIELPIYLDFIEARGDNEFTSEWDGEIFEVNSPWWSRMEIDGGFKKELMTYRLILPSSDQFDVWKAKRKKLELMVDKIFTWKYSLQVAEPTVKTLVCHMFLHGDIAHLIGNMFFLVALGFIVETCLGKFIYTLSYVLIGACSGVLQMPFASENVIMISLGASGAIAGLMGMYTVLFGIRKVRFFYFVYVYFDYVKLPAIFLLPLWLSYEVYQQLAYSDLSNINYMAHIGGLLSGALLAFVIKQVKPEVMDKKYIDEMAQKDKIEDALAKADVYIRQLEHKKAIVLLKKMLEEEPEDHRLLAKYYHCAKLDPGSVGHHDSAWRIFNLTSNYASTNHLVSETFSNYLDANQQSKRIGKSTIIKLANRFLSQEGYRDADVIINLMVNDPHDYPDLPSYILGLVSLFIENGEWKKATEYIEYLKKEYPNHHETAMAVDLVKK